MTPYEIADLAESMGANFLTTFTIIVSLTTTYVIAAFMAGARLSRFQLTVVNLCFVTSVSVIGFLSLQMFQRATVMAQRTAAEFDTQLVPRDVSWIIAVLYCGLVVAAMVFMASVRSDSNHGGTSER
jgi:ABC-type molybdate transport system permease subunit